MTYHRNMKMLQFKFLENMKNYKHDKLKLDIAFLNNRKQLGVFMKFIKNYQLSQIMMLHQYGRDYFAAPLLRVTKNLGINS